MPMSWAGTPLKKNDLRRVLAGVLTAMFGKNAQPSAVAPIAPQNALSTTFQEVVMVDLNRCFTDVAGTAACTGVGQRVACIRDVNGAIAATQSTAAAQPTQSVGQLCALVQWH